MRDELRYGRYRMLSIVWWFPSLGAIGLLARDVSRWRWGAGAAAGLGSVPLEDWIGGVILAIHLFWLWRWRRAAR